MKKINHWKITVLLLLFLCALTMLIIRLRIMHFQNAEKTIMQNVITEIENEKTDKIILKEGEIGIIKIPSIGIKAPIYEGVRSDILKYTVGHFENTSLWNGNVALASHNEGSYAHYFSRIKELKSGEEIIYLTNMGERRYEVYENKIIKETNVEILKNTKENIITLVTCVTGKRNLRQCVIGIEKLD